MKVSFCPSGFALQVFANHGLRTSIVLSSLLNALSTWVRWLGRDSDGFALLLVSQYIAGVSQSLFFTAPPMLSNLWFPLSQRAIATYVVNQTFIHDDGCAFILAYS